MDVAINLPGDKPTFDKRLANSDFNMVSYGCAAPGAAGRQRAEGRGALAGHPTGDGRPILDAARPHEERQVRPLMPLRRGHLAVMVAAGFLDSLVLESGQRRLLVKGRTYKVSVPVYSPDPEVEVEREVLRTSVTVLDLRTGDVDVIDTGAGDAHRA